MKHYSELDEVSQDILRELGNIGTGNAVTSLSNMVGYSFNVELPEVEIVEYKEVPGLLGGAEMFETGIMLQISGDLSGIFMFLLDEEFTKSILNALLGEEDRDLAAMDEMCRSAVCEIGNVVCCSYINALAKLMDVKIYVSVPDICSDMAGAILSVPMIHFANVSEELLMIKNRFRAETLSFTSHVLFLPELESLNKILKVLGV
ncbi:MAG: chemotaxis protein CheC [Clostridiaceae bacterium]|nr:chemotaxis protein CheC [Clostridiaceae bacterium]